MIYLQMSETRFFLTENFRKCKKRKEMETSDMVERIRKLWYEVPNKYKERFPWWAWVPQCIISIAAITIALCALKQQ